MQPYRATLRTVKAWRSGSDAVVHVVGNFLEQQFAATHTVGTRQPLVQPHVLQKSSLNITLAGLPFLIVIHQAVQPDGEA